MNAIVDSKAFKAARRVSVPLPKSFGIAEGAELQREQAPSDIVDREMSDPAEVKRRWLALLDEMEAMPGPGRIQKREPIIFRDE